MSIEGLSHITFIAADLERTAKLAADLPILEARLRSPGVEIQPSRPRVEGEGQSLYFYDFDDNLFELHTGTLEQRLERYAK